MKHDLLRQNHLIILVLLITLFSCQNNTLDVDVSSVDIDMKIKRFEQDLFQHKHQITPQDVANLKEEYGVFFNDFVARVIQVGAAENPHINQALNAFTSDSYIVEVKTDVDNIYTSFSEIEQELTAAFKHYHYYFPKKEVPEIITYISGFNYAVITDEHYLGIGLDMFLGKDYDAYTKLGLPKYKTTFMSKEGVVAGAMLGWVATEYELKEKNANLLTEMIHQGKILYLMDALMPQTENNIKINYNSAQLKWCENNAEPIWFYFIDHQLLYTADTKEIIKYMGEAPFTQGFPEGSPGRIGHWVGWQIVKAYMNKNPSTTLQQLLQINNAQELLKKSGYKP